MTVQEVLQLLREKTGHEPKPSGLGQWSGRCPAHEDNKPSLSIGAGDDGRVLLRCHTGCNTVQIARALGLTMRDLFGDRGLVKERPRIAATYNYCDGNGQLLFQTVRLEPKGFSQRRPDGAGDWIWNLKGVPRVLYRLPELLAADPAEIVFVVEGEKDADSVATLGLVATTNPMGAGKWGCLSDHDALEGRHVAVIPDRDDVGREHALDVANRLHGKAAEVRIAELPDGLWKDVSDWIAELDSRTAEDLRNALQALYTRAPVFDPEPSDAASESSMVMPQFKTVRELLAADLRLNRPIIHGLLRRQETINIIAPSKFGKSWMLMHLLLSVATGRHWFEFATEQTPVLLIDNELHQATSANRLPRVAEAMGIELESVGESVAVDNLRGRLVDLYAMEEYFKALPPGRFGLIALDAFYRFLPVGADENSNAVLAGLYNLLDRWAQELECAFICIHHTSKGNQSGKSVTDVGAGAGAQSRAADSHLVLRHHQEEGAIVLDAAVRSFPPIQPLCLRWNFPLWTPAPELDPEDLRPQRSRRRSAKSNSQLVEQPKPPVWDTTRFVNEFMNNTPKSSGAIFEAAEAKSLSQYKAKQLLKRAEGIGKVFRWRYGSTKPVCFATVPQPELKLKPKARKKKKQ